MEALTSKLATKNATTNVWHAFKNEDPEPFIDLFRHLVSNDFPEASKALLLDLPRRIVDSTYRMDPQMATKFRATGKEALRRCLQNDEAEYERLMQIAMGRSTSWAPSSLLQFGIAQMMIFTAVCGAIISFAGNLTAFAVLYFAVLRESR